MMVPVLTVAPIVVVGAGAFGTALACVLAQTGDRTVTLLARRPQAVEAMVRTGRNDDALPGIDLPPSLVVTCDPACLSSAGIILFAMPSQAQRQAARDLAAHLPPAAAIVTCAKGLEAASGELLTNVLAQELPNHPVAVLSGPGFAADIAAGLPTAMVLASDGRDLSEKLARDLSGPTFRLYPSADPAGVQLGGALKNILAIACGIVEGAGLGNSARAALISRGLAELSRFVEACGGQAETVRGLSGLGDLVLTATSHQSRNLRFGIALGNGQPEGSTSATLVEGALAASIASRRADILGIDLPITRTVAAIIGGRLDVATALEQLMSRPITGE